MPPSPLDIIRFGATFLSSRLSAAAIRIALPVALAMPITAMSGTVLEPSLVRTAVHLAPTEEQLSTVRVFSATWHLPPSAVRSFDHALKVEGLSARLSAELQERLLVLEDGSAAILPDAALLDMFTPEDRALWLSLLANHSANFTYRWPVAISEELIEELLGDPELAEAANRLRRWSFPHAGLLICGDLFALEDAFPSPAARLRFFRRVLGADLWMARLSDEHLDTAALDSIVNYWEMNGRYRAIRPFLSTIVAIDGRDRIDVAHFLPRQARALLNTYSADLQREEDLAAEVGLLAARFFARALEDSLDLSDGFSAWLRRECEPINGKPTFGDLAVFGDIGQTRWPYAAVYIADGVVFTRRPTLHGPWGLYSAGSLADFNPRIASQPIRYYRRRSTMLEPPDPPFRRGDLPPAWRRTLTLRPLHEGPWGRLWCYDLLLTPPGSMLEQLPDASGRPEWKFAGTTPQALVESIGSMDLPPETREGLLDLFRQGTIDANGHVTVHPTLELVLATPREVRERLFPRLVPGYSITDYAQMLRLPAQAKTLDWFSPGVLPLGDREKVAPLVYRLGQSLVLSDYGALFQVFPDRKDRLTALRALFRTPALCVLLEKPSPESLSSLAEYWKLDQQKDVGQLLASFAEAPDMQYLDVLHLLPLAPRQLLNFYAAPVADAGNVSCYWTALNFSAATADTRLLVTPNRAGPQAEIAWNELNTRYVRVDRPGRFGDVIAYREQRADGVLLHVCTFIADDIVYTKNGFSFADPWCLTHLANVDAVFMGQGGVERWVFRLRESEPWHRSSRKETGRSARSTGAALSRLP